MVKIEPDLPEPAREPAALFLGPADRALVQRLLRRTPGSVEVYDGEQPILRREEVRDAVEDWVKVRDLLVMTCLS